MVRVGRQPRLRLLVWVGRLSSAADSAAAAPFLELGELLERLVEARKPGVQLRHSRRGVIADLLVVAEGPFQLDNAAEQAGERFTSRESPTAAGTPRHKLSCSSRSWPRFANSWRAVGKHDEYLRLLYLRRQRLSSTSGAVRHCADDPPERRWKRSPRRCKVSDRVSERRRAAALARHYREQESPTIAEIARRLGRAPATVKAYLYDPSDANKRPTSRPQERQFWALAGHARTSICKRLLGSRCDVTRSAFPTRICPGAEVPSVVIAAPRTAPNS